MDPAAQSVRPGPRRLSGRFGVWNINENFRSGFWRRSDDTRSTYRFCPLHYSAKSEMLAPCELNPADGKCKSFSVIFNSYDNLSDSCVNLDEYTGGASVLNDIVQGLLDAAINDVLSPSGKGFGRLVKGKRDS